MSIEAIESTDETSDTDFQYTEKNREIIWNGRNVSVGNVENHNPDITLCTYLEDVYGTPESSSPLWGYFDSEAKKQNEFDIAVYQYHVRCNNEESKKSMEAAFEKMATGIVGIIVGVIYFSPTGAFMVWNCAKMIWQGVQDFKHSMETSGIPLDEIHFVTWYDDYKRNTDELMQNTILSPWQPLDTSGFELMDKQYERKTLDPTFNPWTYA